VGTSVKLDVFPNRPVNCSFGVFTSNESDYVEGVMAAHTVYNRFLYGIARNRLKLQRTARELRRAIE
jgi:hypothetical protein